MPSFPGKNQRECHDECFVWSPCRSQTQSRGHSERRRSPSLNYNDIFNGCLSGGTQGTPCSPRVERRLLRVRISLFLWRSTDYCLLHVGTSTVFFFPSMCVVRTPGISHGSVNTSVIHMKSALNILGLRTTIFIMTSDASMTSESDCNINVPGVTDCTVMCAV